MIDDDTTIRDVTQRIDRRWIVIACKDYLLNSAHPSETRLRVQPSTQRGSKNTGAFYDSSQQKATLLFIRTFLEADPSLIYSSSSYWFMSLSVDFGVANPGP
jgi:hypothetical protein